MKIYVTDQDDRIYELTIDDKFMPVITLELEEGYPPYERLAAELRRFVEKTVKNPIEAYTTRELAEDCWDPCLCW